MTTEERLAALESANNNLLEEVGGLVEAWNGRIEQFGANLGNVVDGKMIKNYFVDTENGDDNNIGNSANPFKTIERCFVYVANGAMVTINLTAGQTYTLNTKKNISSYTVAIVGNKTNPPILKSVQFDDGGVTKNGGFYTGRGIGYISIANCIPETSDDRDGGESSVMFGAVNSPMVISLSGGELRLKQASLTTSVNGGGGISLILSSTGVISNDTLDAKIVEDLQSTTLNLSVRNVTVSGNMTNIFKLLIGGLKYNGRDAQPYNVNSNVDLS